MKMLHIWPGIAALLLSGCAGTGQFYVYRNPVTGATARCEQKVPFFGSLSPWREGISHAYLQECIDGLAEQGFTERVWE